MLITFTSAQLMAITNSVSSASTWLYCCLDEHTGTYYAEPQEIADICPFLIYKNVDFIWLSLNFLFLFPRSSVI